MMRYGWMLLILMSLAAPLMAATETGLTVPQGPIEITSQQMEADQQSGSVEFSGNVIAKRGTMTVYAERLTLHFVEAKGRREIERMEASGKVRVVDGDRIATAEHLDYLQAEEKMTLRGNAEIHQGENLVAGDEIVLFVRENRSLVKSSKDGRVRAVFLPRQETP